MRKRNPGASTNATRQVNAGQQSQVSYGYPPMAPQQQGYPPQGPGGQGYAPGYPPQAPQGAQRQQSIQPRQNQPQLLEPVDGGPPVIHHGKILMKDAITLITLRLAKLEELTSTSTFHSLINGEITGDSVKDDNTEFLTNIGERLSNLETNVSSIFQDLQELKLCIEALVSQTSIDDEQQILFIQSNANPTPGVSDTADDSLQLSDTEPDHDSENED